MRAKNQKLFKLFKDLRIKQSSKRGSAKSTHQKGNDE
jgi:hypothetical protein